MPDPESQRLDRRILSFIQKYGRAQAPDGAFQSLAFEVFDHQFRRNAYYRKFCELEHKAPSSVRSWKEIPAVPALAFKELVLTSFPPKERVCVFHTSGTTAGTPADAPPRGAHFFDTLRLYERSIVPPFEKYLLAGGGRFSCFFLVPSSAERPHSSLSYMMKVVEKRVAGGRGRYYVKKNAVWFEKLVSDLKKEKKKVLLMATAFALADFLDFLEAGKVRLRLTPGSRLMETGGFKGRVKEISKKVLYGRCGFFLGIPKTHCVSEYGMTELSSQMYGAALGPFSGPAWLRTLVIDPRSGREAKPGAAGLLRHVDLANRGSVMAVQTEDLGRARKGGFDLLGRAKGSELRGCSLSYEELIRSGV